MIQLTEEQLLFFLNCGYLVIDRFVDDGALGRLRHVYDEIIQRLLSGQSDKKYKDLVMSGGLIWIHSPELSHTGLLDDGLLCSARLLASTLLSISVSKIAVSSRIFYKPPLIGREVPWHQDEAYRNPEYDANTVSIWTPLDNSLPANGCMQFIPGSHKQGVRIHRQSSSDHTAGLGLTTDDVNPQQAVPCPVPAGGATFHHCRTLHYSGPNYTNGPRRALVLVCDAPAARREVPDQRPWQNWTNRLWFSEARS